MVAIHRSGVVEAVDVDDAYPFDLCVLRHLPRDDPAPLRRHLEAIAVESEVGIAVAAGSVLSLLPDRERQLLRAVYFEGVTIEPGAVIEDSIIASGAKIGANARITGCVIGEGARIGARCELQDGMRVWPGVHIPDGGVRFSSDA